LKDIQKVIGKTIPLVDEHPFAKAVTTHIPLVSKPSGQRHFGGNNNNHFSGKKAGNQRKTQNYGK
jgi:hypothetical protein